MILSSVAFHILVLASVDEAKWQHFLYEQQFNSIQICLHKSYSQQWSPICTWPVGHSHLFVSELHTRPRPVSQERVESSHGSHRPDPTVRKKSLACTSCDYLHIDINKYLKSLMQSKKRYGKTKYQFISWIRRVLQAEFVVKNWKQKIYRYYRKVNHSKQIPIYSRIQFHCSLHYCRYRCQD